MFLHINSKGSALYIDLEFSKPFKATTGDLVQTIDLALEESCYNQINHSWWFEPLSGVSKSQTWVFVCNSFTIEGLVDSELHMVTWVSTTRSSNRFMVKSIV